MSRTGACPASTATPNADLLARSTVPAIQFWDTDASQKWQIFTNNGEIILRDQTGGNNDVIVAEDGGIDNALYITDDTDGAVGLGTSMPSSHLHLLDSNNPDIRFDNGTNFIEIQQDGTVLGIDASNSIVSARPFQIDTSAPSDSFVLDSRGSVGLGTDSPVRPLDVVTDQVVPLRLTNTGQANLRFALVNGQAGTTWTFDNNGNVFRINQVGGSASGTAFRLFKNGDGRFAGDVFANGNMMLTSSRDMKTDFEPVDADAVLDKVSGLEISEWRYKKDAVTARHIGPFAEDFRSAFGVGDGKHISVVDFAGVSLAAVKALNQEVAEKRRSNFGA